MTPEIEKRIKAVRAGRIPAGYKRTKVGIVPKEWDELKLSHYLSVSKEKNTELKYSKEDVFSISGELGIVNQIELLGRSYAGVSVAPYGVVKPNDVVYTKSPLKANPYGIIKTNKTGKTGIVSTLYAIFNCKNNVNPVFVQYYFESDKNLNDYLHPIVNIGAKHDMKISDENSLNGVVVFPPLSEQKKIADILATQDRVIELKEKLITEKQSQKKYLMSVLLGDDFKKPFKLNGVTIDKKKWEKKKIGDVCDNYTGLTYAPENVSSKGVLVLRSSNIQNGKLCFDDNVYVDMEIPIRSKVKIGDILVCVRNGSRSLIGKSAIITKEAECAAFGAFMTVLRSKNVNQLFLFYIWQSNNIQKQIKVLMGALINQITSFDIQHLHFSCPTLPEQKVIADVLSAADEEISLLQKSLEQEKLKKKSLMQLLLTGLVRVQ